MPDIFDKYSHAKSSSNPTIYVYSESYLPGYLKVGYTTKPVEERMRDIHPLNTPVQTWKVLYTTPAQYPDGTVFMDHDVHKELVRRGFKRVKDDQNKKTENQRDGFFHTVISPSCEAGVSETGEGQS